MAMFTGKFAPDVILPHLEECLIGGNKEHLNVVHLATGNIYGGIERILISIQKYRGLMPRLEHQFYLLFPGRLASELLKANAKVEFLRQVRRRYFWQVWHARFLLGRLLRRSSCHMVLFHSMWTYSIFAPTVRKAGKKIGLWLHDVINREGGIGKSIYKTAPDLVIANSQFTAASFPGNFLEHQCRVVYPMVCPVEIRADKKTELKEKVRADIGCPFDRKVVLIAARFDPYKGHDILFRALAGLPMGLDWECWVAGGVQNNAEKALVAGLKRKAKESGISKKIRWLGHQDKLWEIFASVDLYCQPNTSPEPFGMVFVEAQAVGCPVITTRMGGAMEAIEKTGVNIFLEKPDPTILLGILRNVLSTKDCSTK